MPPNRTLPPTTRWPFLALAAVLGLALTAALLARFETAHAAPPPVNNTNDSGDGSLRQALVDAVEGDTITFDLPANAVITVSSALTVTAAITIDGTTAANLTLTGAGLTRVFSVTAPLHLLGLTVTGGAVAGPGGGLYSTSAVTLTGVTFMSNTAAGRGGGLYTLATLTAAASHFLTNTAQGARGGGAYAEGDAALTGGLFLNNRTTGVSSAGGLGVGGQGTLTGTQFLSNTAGDAAGGLRVIGAASLTSVEFRGNVAGALGGGLLVGGAATLSDTVFVANRAATNAGGAQFNSAATLLGGSFVSNTASANGGGVFAGAGLVFSGTQFISNTATTDGGGLYVVGGLAVGEGAYLYHNLAGDDGGGLVAFSGAYLTATQFLSNTALGDGGALQLEGGDGRLVNLLAARNSAGGIGAGFYLASSGEVVGLHLTVADVTANPRSAIAVEAGTVSLSNTILVGHAYGLRWLGGAVTADYLLFYNTPITATGGMTLGLHLSVGSPSFVNAAADDYHLGLASAATDAGADAGVLLDLDGAARPAHGGFDLGAYERQAVDSRLYLPLVLR